MNVTANGNAALECHLGLINRPYHRCVRLQINVQYLYDIAAQLLAVVLLSD